MVLEERKQFHSPNITPLYPSVLDSCSPLTSPPKRQHQKVRRKYQHHSKNGCFVQYRVNSSNPLPGSVPAASTCQYDTHVIVKVSNVKDDKHLANKDYKQYKRRRLLLGNSTPSNMFIGKLAKSHKQQWKDNNVKHISEYYGKKPIKTLGNMFQESVQRNDTIEENDSSTKSESSSRNGSFHGATVAEVHKDDTKNRNHTHDNVEVMNEKNTIEGKEEKTDKKTDFSKFKRQTLKFKKYFTPGSKENANNIKTSERTLDISTQKDEQSQMSNGNGESDFSQIEICKDTRQDGEYTNCHQNPRYDSTTKEEDLNENYKSVGVQASPFPPFRLRFLPKDDWRETDNKFHKLLKLVLSQCGLACIVLTWAMMGALVFRLTEGPQEQRQVEEMARQQSSLVIGLATDLRQVVPQEPIWRQTIERYADRHEALILSAVSSGYPQRGTIWTYPGSLLFATSLLTTLGFGAPVPRTVIGRMSAVIFAGLGIPMHLLLILNIGLFIVVKLTRLANVCSHKVKFLKFKIQKVKSRRDFEGNSSPQWPEELFASEQTTPPYWLKYFPLVAIPMYYLTGFLLFGVARGKDFPEVFLFPLDFTAAGGVASTYGPLRIVYAMYLEGAVILASTNVALLRVSATRGFTSASIKLGLMTNSLH